MFQILSTCCLVSVSTNAIFFLVSEYKDFLEVILYSFIGCIASILDFFLFLCPIINSLIGTLRLKGNVKLDSHKVNFFYSFDNVGFLELWKIFILKI